MLGTVSQQQDTFCLCASHTSDVSNHDSHAMILYKNTQSALLDSQFSRMEKTHPCKGNCQVESILTCKLCDLEKLHSSVSSQNPFYTAKQIPPFPSQDSVELRHNVPSGLAKLTDYIMHSKRKWWY